MNDLTGNAKGNKILSHDAVLSRCFQYTWNKYPQTRYSVFHVMNESRPIPPNLMNQMIVSFLKFIGHYASPELIRTFCSRQLFDKEHQIRMAQNKAIGVVPGVLDMLAYIDCKLYAFDVKVGKDRLSDHQRAFISQTEKNGGKCFVIENYEQFVEIFDGIMNKA